MERARGGASSSFGSFGAKVKVCLRAKRGPKQSKKQPGIMGDRLEEKKDFTAEVTAKLPEAKKLAEVCMYVRRWWWFNQ